MLVYWVPLAAGDEAAMSMKHTGSRLPAGSEYRRMLLPEATARLLTLESMSKDRLSPSLASSWAASFRLGAEYKRVAGFP
jgi:hypothetical protein